MLFIIAILELFVLLGRLSIVFIFSLQELESSDDTINMENRPVINITVGNNILSFFTNYTLKLINAKHFSMAISFVGLKKIILVLEQ